MIQKIILGTAQIGLDYGINNATGKISFQKSCEILHKAFKLGITTLDTAEAYGNAHDVIGHYHKLNPAAIFNIITKVPHGDLDDIETKVYKYIKDLNVQSLDSLMFHSFDSYINNKKSLKVLIKLKEQGIIKNIGVSLYTNAQIQTLLLDDDITLVQMPFNLLDNISLRGNLMTQLKEKGKIIHTRSAFLQGLFFKENLENNAISQKLSNELIIIKNLAKERNTSISNLALSYCLNQEIIDQVLIGVDSEDQLIDNLEALNYKIDQEVINRINSLEIKDLDLLNPSLWK